MNMNNRWNRFVYRLWAPIYDALLRRLFQPGRLRAMEAVGLRATEQVCLVGVGTGADLQLLPHGVQAVGVDLSNAMLARARRKLPIAGRSIELRVGDAQRLPLENGSVDAVVLNLILSVVPDPSRCMTEALRILRPGGRIVVFDKFLPDNAKPSWLRKLGNGFTTPLGTDINRRFGDIITGMPCDIVHNEASIFRGAYRVVLLRATGPAATPLGA